jgi:multiple sugar transport system permease protein
MRENMRHHKRIAGARLAGIPRRRPPHRRRIPQRFLPAVLLAPAMILICAFVVAPVGAVIPLALFHWNLLAGTASFAGLGNFRDVLPDPAFHQALANTFWYYLLTAPISLFLGLLVALAIRAATWGRSVWQAVYFLPVASTLVAMAVVWQWMFRPDTGVIDLTIGRLTGLRDWLNSLHLALPAVAVIQDWYQIGFVALIYLAGLQAVPSRLLEAARLDGAGPLARFAHVIWPSLGPTTVFALVITSLNAISIYDAIAVTTQGGPAGHTESLTYYLWQEGIYYFNVGDGAVITVILVAITLAFLSLLLRSFGRRLEEAGSR